MPFGAIGTLFEFLIVIAVILLPMAIMMSNTIGSLIPLLGANATPIKFIYSFIVGIIDNSFIFLFVLAMFADVYMSYVEPSRLRAVENIIGFFLVSYFYIVFSNFIPSLSALQFSTLLPTTSGFFGNGWYIAVVFFTIVMSVVFNMRDESHHSAYSQAPVTR